MNLKVGDKVRIKSKEQLLKDNWTQRKNYLVNYFARLPYMCLNYCEQIVLIEKIAFSDNTFYANGYWFNMCVIDEVVEDTENTGITLDEYICSLPLEERAERFLYRNPIRSISLEKDEGYDREEIWWLSAITSKGYLTYNEALQATIEALKQPKVGK